MELTRHKGRQHSPLASQVLWVGVEQVEQPCVPWVGRYMGQHVHALVPEGVGEQQHKLPANVTDRGSCVSARCGQVEVTE
jgi:hypothetical protein